MHYNNNKNCIRSVCRCFLYLAVKQRHIKSVLDSHYIFFIHLSRWNRFRRVIFLSSFVQNVPFLSLVSCNTVHFLLYRFYFDFFFHLCRQVVTYLVYICVCVLLSPLYRQTAVRFIYIFSNTFHVANEREAEPLNGVFSPCKEERRSAWTSMLNTEKRNEWWQSETFTITVDYNCRLKFLRVVNTGAKEHFHTTTAAGFISAMLNPCTACNKMFIMTLFLFYFIVFSSKLEYYFSAFYVLLFQLFDCHTIETDI